MTVKELIEILSELNSEDKVVIFKQLGEQPEVICMLDAETDEEFIMIR